MPEKNDSNLSKEQKTTDAVKNWVMAALTFIFVLLYAAALLGWLKPLSDVTMISRLEPTIFVIIGYYFGRLPAQQNEKTLKEEISRQTQKADAAQHVKEQAQQQREVLEEKVKNAKVALTFNPMKVSAAREGSLSADHAHEDRTARHSIETAVNILNS